MSETKLPKGWAETQLGEIFSIVTGNTPSKKHSEYYGNDIPWVKPADINRSTVLLKTDEYLSHIGSKKARMLPKGAVMVTCIGNLGYVAISGTECATNQQINSIVDKSGKFNSKYIFYFSFGLKRWLTENSTSTTISMVNKSVFSRAPFYFPPRPEQDRIVAKVDTLMAQVATMQKSMERIPLLLKDFRQQVLTQAVTGKLTEEWRRERKLEIWESKKSSEIFEFITSGSRGWAKYYSHSGKQLFVRITNMNFGTYKLDLRQEKLQFLDLKDVNEGKRTLLKPRDILISITGDVGIISLIEDDFPYEGYVNQHVCLARPISDINELYLTYFLMSNVGLGQFNSKKRGATKAGLTLGDIRSLDILLPNIQEQQEIVRRVESLFVKAGAIEKQYQTLKTKIDTLPQAILNKAFKGELVEQLESDGDARELLREIEGLKTATTTKPTAKKKKLQPYKQEKETLRRVAEDGPNYKA